jgi:hypothetical protein
MKNKKLVDIRYRISGHYSLIMVIAQRQKQKYRRVLTTLLGLTGIVGASAEEVPETCIKN